MKTVGVHVLVAETWLPRIEINHLDNNPQNNHFSNLAYATHKQNMEYARIQGRLKCFGRNSDG